MDILVNVQGSIRDYLQTAENPFNLTVPDNTTVGDIIRNMGIPIERGWNASVRGKLVSDVDQLHHGDRLMIFDVIGGG